MPQYIPLPNGAYFELQEGERPEVGLRRAQAKYPEAFAAPASAPAAKPESGFMPALRAGATELGGGISALMGKVGLKDEAKAEAEYQAAKKRAAEIFKPTEEGWTEAPFTKFKELLGGSLPYMAAPLAAGAAAAALPISGTAATIAGLGAAGLTSAGQFTATNLARQMEGEEGAMPKKSLGETSLPSAMAAAVPQALLDTLSMRMIPGIGRIFGQAGVKITAENAKEIAEQGLKKTLADYALKTGKTAGVEGATEAAQQVFERLQAGLNITDEKARDEYFESFLGGAVLGGTLAPAGRFVERGREQREARGLLDQQATKEREAALAEEKAKKAQPDYILGVADQYEALNKQKADLMAQVIKGTKESPLSQADKDRNVLIQQQLKELEPKLKEQRKEYLSLGGPNTVEKLREQKRIEAMTPEEYAEYSYAQRAVPGKPRAAAPPVEEKLAPEFADPLAAYEKGPSQAVIDYVAAQMRTAQRLDQGNFDVNDYAQFLIQDPAMAQRVVAERPAIPGVSEQESAAILDGLKLQLEALGGEMAAGREAAGVERTQAGLEQQVAREQAAQRAATQQQLEFEGTAEREAMQEAAAARASDMRARELQPLQTAPQTALFPEVREGEVDTRPKGTLTERLNTLTERILAAPNVDDATKDLAQQVQDNLPQVAAQLRAQTEELAQRAPQRGVAPRVTPRAVPQGDEVAQIADWAQSVLQGRASPEMTADLRAAVQALQAGQRSETEQVTQYAGRALTAQEKQDVAGTSLEGRQGVMTREPTGEVRRAVQTEIAMPEPTAKAFESFGAFNDYLASEGLQAYRTQKGLVFPTLSNLQRRLAPIQTRVAELQAQLDDVNAKRAALQKADAAERGAASELLRESQQKLQATVKTLDETARTTYVGAKLKEVDLVKLLDQAHGRLNASLAHSANLRQQFAQALGKIASAEEAAKPVMVDAKGNATTKEKAAVRTVAQGQLPGYQALRKAQLDLQAKGNALVEADQKLEQVVKAGIGQSWETGSPTLTAYLKAKKVKDEAQRAAQQAHFAVLQAYRRVPSTEALNNNLSKFLAEKGSIDTEMAKAAKSLSAIRLGVRNASNRLNDAYVRMENNPELRFGENLLRLRQDLLAAQNISEEAMGRSVERQAQVGELAKEAKGIAEPMRKQQALVRGVLEGAAERAEARRGVPAKETQADREARDAEKRREEQARLERQEAIPATRVEFERAETDNQETRRLAEAVGEAPNAEARAAARKAFDEHLKALVARKDAELDDMKRKAAKNVQDLNTQRKAVAELTERLKGDLTPKRRESAEKQLAEAKRKLAEHERRYTLNTREMKIKRTDIQAQREERNRLLAEANRSRVAGERLGVAEGTQQRALSPVTGAKTIPPKKMFTGSEESKAGATTTDTRQKLTEARGEKQRDVAMSKKEQAEANRIAAELAKKTPEQKAKEQAEEEAVQKEQAKLQGTPAKVTPLRSEKATRRKGEVISELEEELDSFEIEILPGENQEVFFSRGATPSPSTTASVRTELKKAFPDLGRVQIFDTVDALIAANPQYEGRIPSDARGFVDTAGNKAFLIAENINQGQALSVLLHEVGAHIGLKNMLGAAQYNALVKAVDTWAKKNDGSIESRVAQAARARVEAAKTPASQKDDELLAYAIEEAVNAGVKPTETKGVIGRWLSQIAALFRRGLEKFGLPPKALDAQGIVDMAFGAAKLEMRGQATPEAGGRGDLRFSYAGEKSGVAPDALRKAKDLQIKGAEMEKIWNETGWFQGPDKKWRYEIDDSKAKFNITDLTNKYAPGIGNKHRTTIGALMEHPELYALYPDIKNIQVTLYNDPNSNTLGSFDRTKKEIELNVGTSYDPEKVLLHELQHYIQGEEGFTRGGSSTGKYLEGYTKSILNAVRESYVREAEENAGEKYYADKVKAIDAGIAAAQAVKSKRAAELIAARAEWQKTSRAIEAELETLKNEYKSRQDAAAKARDAYYDASDAYLALLQSPDKSGAERFEKVAAAKAKSDQALDALNKAEAAEVPYADYSKRSSELRDQKRKAHTDWLKVRYAGKVDIETTVNNAIQSAMPKGSFFGKFARLTISEQAYQNLLGEVEARDVEERLKLSEKDRRDTRPYSSQPQRREEILFSRNLPTAARVADNLIAKEKGVIQNLKDNFLGVGFRAQFVDKLAPLEEALKKGGISTTKALQAMYYLRMYDQRMHFTSQAIADGVPEIVEKARKDGGIERLIETKPGANISQVVDILKKKDVVKAAGSPDAANRLFTLYLAAIRAERVGMDALNFGGKVTEADLKAARAEIEANPTLKNAFDEARDIYNQYNRNLIEFAVQTGALAKSEAKALLASNDYIPYYRMRDGVAQLIVGNETPIRIGNLKDSPHLKELVGGDEAIFDFLTSSVQNTAMLLDMSMKNLATKNAMFELKDVGLATVSKVPKSGKTPEGAVTFKRDGEDYFAVVDTDKIGISGDLLVKGLAGIPTMFPAIVRVLGIPSRILRRAVVASPVYMARQMFRDSLAAAMTSGADITPMMSALKQIGKPDALKSRGITGGQVFTGMPEDVTRMLKDMQAGKVSITSGLAWLEAKSAQADGLTRRAQYESYLKQGLSEMEATYMALESMNFSKRGLSPTLHMVSTLIPFFNAQIQGLDVLYKAFTGQMPMNERLAIREKLWTRGMLLAGMSIAYAMAMQDDEAYKNARPDEKYGNWFVRVPGFDEPLRLPIPFELGYVFKALPEALVNIMANDKGGEEALKAAIHIGKQTVPGLSNYFLPQAVKPALETILGTSIYTGRGIESSREQMSEPGFRYREGTTELARQVGELTGFSPIKMEYLIRGYTGGMGIALLQALSAPFGSNGPEAATKRLSDLPVIGTLFQPVDAGGIIDATYERMKQVNQVKETYEGLLEKGRTADAQKYLAERTDEMALASMAGSFRQYMGQITEFERNIRASSMTPDQKREKLDQARQMKIRLAESVRAVADRKTPQASPA